MIKKMLIVVMLICIINLMYGCSVKNSTASPIITIELTPIPTEVAPTPTEVAPTPTELGQILKDEISLKEITESEFFELLSYQKEKVLKILGDNYEVGDSGVEGSEEGYLYYNLDIVIIFDIKNKIKSIYCGRNFKIKGVSANMNFAQIKENLGNTEVIETSFEIPNNKMYEISYSFENCIFKFLSTEKDGKDSMFIIVRK